ncbi:MAG: hypothetical protein OXG72_20070 [Acidobacteria bacterium]|nr:hypothetical protein [Acidobacteriota bacterium]
MPSVRAIDFEPSGERGAFRVGFPYDRALLDAFKASFPRIRFDRASKSWLVPADDGNCAKLDAFASTHGTETLERACNGAHHRGHW